MVIPEEVLNFIPAIAHTVSHSLHPENEMCGVIDLTLGKLHVFENLADDPKTDFRLDASTLYTDNIVVWHTHMKRNGQLSVADVKSCRETLTPYLMFCPALNAIDYYDPRVQQSLIGREFHWAYSHCFDLVRDFYKQEFDLYLNPYYLSSSTEFSESTFNTIEANLYPEGFRLLESGDTWERGDLITMKIGSGRVNHCAIVWDVEANEILQQLIDKRSEVKGYSAAYRKATVGIYRHASRL
jgi:proteasome lid subunit RPN8/RPN11